jgi:hypothetical protein
MIAPLTGAPQDRAVRLKGTEKAGLHTTLVRATWRTMVAAIDEQVAAPVAIHITNPNIAPERVALASDQEELRDGDLPMQCGVFTRWRMGNAGIVLLGSQMPWQDRQSSQGNPTGKQI